MGLIVTLIIGGVIGWLASLVMKTGGQMGIIANIVVGIIGAVLGFWLAGELGIVAVGSVGAWIISIIGAVVLIAILKAMNVYKSRTSSSAAMPRVDHPRHPGPHARLVRSARGRLIHPFELIWQLQDDLPWIRQYQLVQEREDRDHASSGASCGATSTRRGCRAGGPGRPPTGAGRDGRHCVGAGDRAGA